MYLLKRDIELLKALTYKVRLFSIEQIATTWWPDSKREKAKDKLLQLKSKGFVIRHNVLAQPMLELEKPVFTWSPGEEPPDARTLSGVFRNRWKAQGAPVATPVYIASRFTAHLLGGAGGKLYADTATHDLHVSGVYLHFLNTDPVAAQAWVGEDVKGKAGANMKDPDAFVEYDDGSTLIIEFAGSYTLKQVSSFHEHCEKHKLRYQLW